MPNIQYIKRANLDVDKWNTCIDTAPNGLIYAYTFYLDAMCDNWDALVLNDYEAVMPLPWRKKWGIAYLYQPSFVNSLGVFSARAHQIDVNPFIDSIPVKFKYWDLDFNESNKISGNILNVNKLKLKIRNNYLLPLNHPYEYIYNNYKRLAKRKLYKAQESGLTVQRNVDPGKVISEYATHYALKHPDLPMEAYDQLLAFCLKYPEQINTYLACLPNGATAAFYLLLKDNRYVYSILGGSTESGKEAGAFYLLTDTAIRDVDNISLIFRFEGSDAKGIAFFNQQFGPHHINYCYLNYNGLPWPLNLFKRMKN